MLKINQSNIIKGSMVLDMDDVLVFTTSYWFNLLMTNSFDKIKPYVITDIINIQKNYDYNKNFYEPLLRPIYNFGDWMLKPELTKSDKLIGMSYIMETYLENKEFYDNVLQTPLVNACIDIFNYKNFKFDKIYIVTRTFDEVITQKTECIKKLFSSVIKNVEIIYVEEHEKKSECIKDIEHISLLIDDELSNIYDYLDNCIDKLKDGMIIIPMTGYNVPIDSKYIKLAKENNVSLKISNYFK